MILGLKHVYHGDKTRDWILENAVSQKHKRVSEVLSESVGSVFQVRHRKKLVP